MQECQVKRLTHPEYLEREVRYMTNRINFVKKSRMIVRTIAGINGSNMSISLSFDNYATVGMRRWITSDLID